MTATTKQDSRTVYDLYALYLKAPHIPPDGCNVVITGAEIVDLYPRPGSNEVKPALVLSFKGAKRKLILNQGNASRMVDLGGDDHTAWIGMVIRLERARLTKTKDTIHVLPARRNDNTGGAARGQGQQGPAAQEPGASGPAAPPVDDTEDIPF